jgi:YfiH family protein
MMIEAADLRIDGIVHGFFTRQGGCSAGVFSSLNCGLGSGDDPAKVHANRAIAAHRLDVEPEVLLSAWQVHSADAMVVTGPWPGGERPKVDGLVTRTPGVALGVLTADCGPILFADPVARVVGAAHAGWKGALGGVTASTLALMEQEGARRERIVAVIGPMISREAYEVGPEFPECFAQADAANVRFFSPSRRQGHFMFDLPAYLANRLSAEGVGKVANLGLCTYAGEDWFFSYRRTTHRNESDYGRLISAIAIA